MEDWTSKEWDVFFSIFEKLPRGGPGNNLSTRRAYGLLKDLPERPRILDVGCGPGMQTLELARLSKGEIWAIDNHQAFLDVLSRNAAKEGLGSRIKTVNMDMCSLSVTKKFFDVIWAEGAVYFYGYENALKNWKDLFRKEIRFAFSEPNKFEENVPAEAMEIWQGYPLEGIPDTLKKIENLGYEVSGYFKLPKESWDNHYYNPLRNAIEDYAGSNPASGPAKTVIDALRFEMDSYEKYCKYYGYTFYVCRLKTGITDIRLID